MAIEIMPPGRDVGWFFYAFLCLNDANERPWRQEKVKACSDKESGRCECSFLRFTCHTCDAYNQFHMLSYPYQNRTLTTEYVNFMSEEAENGLFMYGSAETTGGEAKF